MCWITPRPRPLLQCLQKDGLARAWVHLSDVTRSVRTYATLILSRETPGHSCIAVSICFEQRVDARPISSIFCWCFVSRFWRRPRQSSRKVNKLVEFGFFIYIMFCAQWTVLYFSFMHRTNWEFRKFYEILCELEEVEVAAVMAVAVATTVEKAASTMMYCSVIAVAISFISCW